MKKTFLALAIASLFAVSTESCTSSYEDFETEVTAPNFEAPSNDGNIGDKPDRGE